MRVLFVMRHGGYVRNFEWVLRLLAERSHQVHLGFERGRAGGMAERIERGRADFPLPERLHERDRRRRHAWARSHPRRPLAQPGVRPAPVGQLPALPVARVRRRDQAPGPVGAEHAAARPCGSRGFRGCAPGPAAGCSSAPSAPSERLIPRSKEIDDALRREAWDLVVITPLVDGPSQHDWLRSARALGIPAVLAVASWDNLTNKGVLFDRPDRTYVWNEIQRREAIELHGLDAGLGRRRRRASLRPLVRLAAGDDARRVLRDRRGSIPSGRSCSTRARPASSPRTSGRSSRAGWRRCARIRSSPTSACSSGRIPPTARPGPSIRSAAWPASPSGPRWARIRPTTNGVRRSTTRCTTQRRSSAPTRPR